MHDYDTLSEAVNDLENRGFTYSFDLKSDCIECKELDTDYKPDLFEVVEVYRFEGMSSAGDSSVVYAVETSDGNKGLIIDAYGAYSEALTPEMLQRLRIRRN